jgi:hypothetical protein
MPDRAGPRTGSRPGPVHHAPGPPLGGAALPSRPAAAASTSGTSICAQPRCGTRLARSRAQGNPTRRGGLGEHRGRDRAGTAAVDRDPATRPKAPPSPGRTTHRRLVVERLAARRRCRAWEHRRSPRCRAAAWENSRARRNGQGTGRRCCEPRARAARGTVRGRCGTGNPAAEAAKLAAGRLWG